MKSPKFIYLKAFALVALTVSMLSVPSETHASAAPLKKCAELTPFKAISGLSMVDKEFTSNICGPGETRDYLYAGKVNKGPAIATALNRFRAAKARIFSWDQKWMNKTVTTARLKKNIPELCQLSEGAIGGTPTQLSNTLIDAIGQECSYVGLSLDDFKKQVSVFVRVYPVEVYFASQFTSRTRVLFYVSVRWEYWYDGH
jgi:hypothetical protein